MDILSIWNISVCILHFFSGEKKQMHDFYKERGLEVPKPGEL